jgi:hypothetical protein
LQRCELDIAITASTPAATKSAIVATPQCVWRCSFCNHAIIKSQTAEAGTPKVSGLRGRIQSTSLIFFGCVSLLKLGCCSLFIRLGILYTANRLSKLQAPAASLLRVSDASWYTHCWRRRRIRRRSQCGLDHVVCCNFSLPAYFVSDYCLQGASAAATVDTCCT